jgi:hypothetical protein
MKNKETVTIELRAFDSICKSCGHRFVGVDFSDFEYGKRILRTKGGKHLVLWVAHDDETYNEFDSMLRTITGSLKSTRDEADLFDRVFGITCDPVNGDPVDASQKQVCPNCTSDSTDTFDIVPMRTVRTEVYRVQHTLWNQKTTDKKLAELKSALHELNAI